MTGQRSEDVTATERGCYLCAPDDPLADEEACTACDAEFWRNPVFIYVEEAADGC